MAKHKRQRNDKHIRGHNTSFEKSEHAKPKSAPPAKEEVKHVVPFELEQRILLVGEGDFSFARSLVEHHGCCDITATCLDKRDDLFAKYEPQGEQNVQYLNTEGQTVLYEVDATMLEKNKALSKSDKFDRILFNFPHVGGKSTDVNRQVRFNQELLFKFFKSAASLLGHEGSIIVTLFDGEPYTLWNIRDLARSNDLMVERSFTFHADAYPGYKHARTLGNIVGGGGWKGEERGARSYIFKLKAGSATPKPMLPRSKRKRAGDSDSDAE